MIEGEDLESRPRPEHITLAEESTVVSRSKVPGRWVDAVDLRKGDVLFQRDRGQVPLTRMVKKLI